MNDLQIGPMPVLPASGLLHQRPYDVATRSTRFRVRARRTISRPWAGLRCAGRVEPKRRLCWLNPFSASLRCLQIGHGKDLRTLQQQVALRQVDGDQPRQPPWSRRGGTRRRWKRASPPHTLAYGARVKPMVASQALLAG